jgi:NAD(P)-dependent dehydrogenase (short-subunit alcohol dehydrogenase family)
VVGSYVVTGGGRGVGRAIVERLLGDGGVVVAIELDPEALAWTGGHPAGNRVVGVAGDAADEAVTGRAADLAEAAAGGSTTRRCSATPRSIPTRPRRCWS